MLEYPHIMLYILFGADDYSASQSLEDIKKGLGEPSLLSTNTTLLDGKNLTVSQLNEVCAALPFLAPKRLVVVKGLLERFEPKLGQGRQKKNDKQGRKKSRQEGYKDFAALVGGFPESTVLVLVDGEIKNRNPLLKELMGKSQVKSFPLLRNEKLKQWIGQHVKKEGGSISPAAAELLAQMVGGNLWVMSGEIAKLALFASGRCIDEEDVKAVVGYSQQANIFNMVDAVLESRAQQAQRAIQQLLQAGLAPPYLLYMLSRQARLLVQVKDMARQGIPQYEIQTKLGLMSDFVWRKTSEQAGRYTLTQLKRLYHCLLEADLSIKTGRYEPELALSILAAELCR